MSVYADIYMYVCVYVCTLYEWELIRMYAELEIAACHLPFSEQNMNMADQNSVGSAIWLTTKTES